MKYTVVPFVLSALLLCACGESHTKRVSDTDSAAEYPEALVATHGKITAEMAYQGVSNYCHTAYDWSVAEDQPDLMYIQMGEETDDAYQVVFRSYTGALVHFYVDKTDGHTSLVESVPSLGIEEDAGAFELFDYLGKE